MGRNSLEGERTVRKNSRGTHINKTWRQQQPTFGENLLFDSAQHSDKDVLKDNETLFYLLETAEPPRAFEQESNKIKMVL